MINRIKNPRNFFFNIAFLLILIIMLILIGLQSVHYIAKWSGWADNTTIISAIKIVNNHPQIISSTSGLWAGFKFDFHSIIPSMFFSFLFLILCLKRIYLVFPCLIQYTMTSLPEASRDWPFLIFTPHPNFFYLILMNICAFLMLVLFFVGIFGTILWVYKLTYRSPPIDLNEKNNSLDIKIKPITTPTPETSYPSFKKITGLKALGIKLMLLYTYFYIIYASATGGLLAPLFRGTIL